MFLFRVYIFYYMMLIMTCVFMFFYEGKNHICHDNIYVTSLMVLDN